MKHILFIFTFLTFACITIPSIQKTNVKDRYFEFQYSVDIQSTNGEKLELWIPVPKSNEVQTISNFQLETDGLNATIEKEISHNNQYLYVYEKNGTFTNTTITMKFNVLRQEHSNVNYKNVNPKNYLSSYSNVPVGGMFDQVIKENNLSKNNIQNIYHFVFNGMHYGKPKSIHDPYYQDPWLHDNGTYGRKKVTRDNVVDLYQKSIEDGNNYTFGKGNAVYACDIGVGNCTDYHSYFMSLNRSMDIPARFHMGFSIPSNKEGNVGGYHCWADYYVKDKGWFPVDISEADKDPKKKDYFFGTVCENRFEMVVGRDFSLKGYDNGNINLFIYPIMEINDIISTNYSKHFKYKNL